MSGYGSAMEGLYDALAGHGHCDSRELVASETRLLAKQIMQFTPPLGPGGTNAGAKKAGEEAIRKEVYSLFVEVEPQLIDEVCSAHGVKDIKNVWRTRDDGTRLELDWRNVDYDGSNLEKWHAKYRQPKTGKVDKRFRGRANTWAARVVVPKGSVAPYVKKLQQRVGRWRATWARVILDLPGEGSPKIPAWIQRHVSKVQDISISSGIAGLLKRGNPSVDFGSRAFGVNSQWARIQGAIRARGQAMAKRTRLILSGYNKDLAKGMRAQRGRHKVNEETQA